MKAVKVVVQAEHQGILISRRLCHDVRGSKCTSETLAILLPCYYFAGSGVWEMLFDTGRRVIACGSASFSLPHTLFS